MKVRRREGGRKEKNKKNKWRKVQYDGSWKAIARGVKFADKKLSFSYPWLIVAVPGRWWWAHSGFFLFGLGCWHGVDVFLRAFVVGDVSDF